MVEVAAGSPSLKISVALAIRLTALLIRIDKTWNSLGTSVPAESTVNVATEGATGVGIILSLGILLF